jgi:hypothetical protein
MNECKFSMYILVLRCLTAYTKYETICITRVEETDIQKKYLVAVLPTKL